MEEDESTLWGNDRKGKTKRMQSMTYMIQIEKLRTKKPNQQRKRLEEKGITTKPLLEKAQKDDILNKRIAIKLHYHFSTRLGF